MATRRYFFVLPVMLTACGDSAEQSDTAVQMHPSFVSTPANLNFQSSLIHIHFNDLALGPIQSQQLCQSGLTQYCGTTAQQRARIAQHTAYADYEIVMWLGSPALKITVDPAKNTANELMEFFYDRQDLGADYPALYYSYRIYYPDNFDEGRGFKAPVGLAGAVVGQRFPTGCGVLDADQGFSVRSMLRWHGVNGLGQRVMPRDLSKMTTYNYVYHQHNTSSDNCGDRISYTDNWEYRKGLAQGYLVETHVSMNTAGERNGLIATTINGHLVYQQQQFMFSQSGGYGINHALIHMHYGGDSSWNPQQKTYVIVDDIVVSTQSVLR